MTSRTSRSVVQFRAPFRLKGLDAPQPAGTYEIDTDEELIDDISRVAWRRVGAFIHIPAVGSAAPSRQMVPVEPDDLEAALQKDRNP